jgi:tRNA(Ile)-lysidine synthase
MVLMDTPFADHPALRRFYWRFEKDLVACLPEPSARVLCALSGGCDSLVLARMLREAQQRGLCAVTLGHVNHCLRPEADHDEALVRATASAWGVGLQVERVDAAAHARAVGFSVEQAARQVRLQALARMARSAGCRLIALGHHMDDQAETVLLRMLRGTGPGGLGAMAARDPLPVAEVTPRSSDGDLLLIRPLLGFRRAQLRDVATQADLTWAQDASNSDPGFLRNRVRHELLPRLAADFNPRIVEGLADLAAWQRAADAVVGSLAVTALRGARGGPEPGGGDVALDAARVAAEPEAVATRVLWMAYQELAGCEAALSSEHMRQLLQLLADARGQAPGTVAPAGQVHLPGHIRAVRAKEWLRFEFRDPHDGRSGTPPGGLAAFPSDMPPRSMPPGSAPPRNT